jgi:hypothetical protein
LVLWVAQSARTYARTLSPKVVEEALRSLRIDPYKPRRGRSKSDDDSMNREPSNTVEGAQDPLSTANL